MHNVVLSFCTLTLRKFTVTSLGKRSAISVTQRRGVNDRRISSKNVLIWKCCKVRKPSNRTGQPC